jgi:lysophospholipase L1-like esterase
VEWSSVVRKTTLVLALPAVLLGALLTARCADKPTAPTPPATDAPRITCPAPQATQSPDGQPVTVTFVSPTVVGGATPVATACAPLTGSKFPAGVNTVACTVTDSQQRSATCTFTVTIQVPPPTPSRLLSLTRFTSFGDSITQGKTTAGSLAAQSVEPCKEPVPNDRSTAYPALLQAKLKQQYPAQAQAIAVPNHGCGGDKAADAWASGRFVSVLTAESPQVLLLFDGANDLSGTDTSTITAAVGALRSMVQEARRRGIAVFLATLLPQRGVRCTCPDPYRATGPTLVQPANEQIRSLAAAEGATLVDLYQAFGGSPEPYIDTDGIHPTLDGHKVIADAFFASIKARLEIAGTTILSDR